jgi:3-dehydroquinate dehydratase I
LAAKICASVGASTASAMKEQAISAFSRGADYVELRFDYLRPEELAQAVAAAGDMREKSVYTLRAKGQGGKFSGSELERIAWLRNFAEQKPMLVDVELETLKENDELADFFDTQKTRILVSWHNFDSTPAQDELADILSEMRVYSNFVKIVTMAKTIDDALRLLDLYDGTIGLNAIIFAMGEPGIISRVLCTIAGNAPFTYASLGNAVAAGQLTIEDMHRIYTRITKQHT